MEYAAFVETIAGVEYAAFVETIAGVACGGVEYAGVACVGVEYAGVACVGVEYAGVACVGVGPVSTSAEPVQDRVLTAPNVLSGLRLATVPFFVWLFVGGRENLGVGIYAAAAWTDFFDGYIARRTGSVSRLGQLLDPLADRVFIVALAIALVGRDALPLWLALVVIARDVLVLALWPLLERIGMRRIQVNFTGKTATACLLFGLTWLAWGETSFWLHSAGHSIGMPFVVAGAILYWTAGVMYAAEARKRVRELERRHGLGASDRA